MGRSDLGFSDYFVIFDPKQVPGGVGGVRGGDRVPMSPSASRSFYFGKQGSKSTAPTCSPPTLEDSFQSYLLDGTLPRAELCLLCLHTLGAMDGYPWIFNKEATETPQGEGGVGGFLPSLSFPEISAAVAKLLGKSKQAACTQGMPSLPISD